MFILCYEGAHYRLSVAYKGDAISMISDLILKALPSARLFASTDAELTFLLPAADKAQFVSVLTSLEMSPFVLSVGISMPTMEDVFLRCFVGLHYDSCGVYVLFMLATLTLGMTKIWISRLVLNGGGAMFFQKAVIGECMCIVD